MINSYYCSIVHVVLQEYSLSRNEFVSLIILKIIFQKSSDRTPDKISRTLDMGSINYMYYSLITFMLYLCPHCFHNLKIAFFKNWIIKRICLKGNSCRQLIPNGVAVSASYLSYNAEIEQLQIAGVFPLVVVFFFLTKTRLTIWYFA